MEKFVMRGRTPSGETEILNFSGFKPGYAYKMTNFEIYPSEGIGSVHAELAATVTAAKTFEDPLVPNFNNEGLIAVACRDQQIGPNDRTNERQTIINDTYLITQNLILAVIDNSASGTPMAVNWQCTFEPVKMSGAEEAVANYKQYMISDGSQ